MKRAGAEREQAGIAGEQIEPDRGEREHQERDHHRLEQKIVAEERHDHERDEQDQRDADAVLQDREHRHVGGVARLELAGLAIEHDRVPQIRSMMRSPNRPCGRNSRKMSAIT